MNAKKQVKLVIDKGISKTSYFQLNPRCYFTQKRGKIELKMTYILSVIFILHKKT